MMKISNRRIAKVKGKDFLKWYRSNEAEKLKLLEGLRGSSSLSPIETFNKEEKVKKSKPKPKKVEDKPITSNLPPTNIKRSDIIGVSLSILEGFNDSPTVELYNGSYRELKIYKDKSLSTLYKTVSAYESVIIERLPTLRYDFYVEEVFGNLEVKVSTFGEELRVKKVIESKIRPSDKIPLRAGELLTSANGRVYGRDSERLRFNVKVVYSMYSHRSYIGSRSNKPIHVFKVNEVEERIRGTDMFAKVYEIQQDYPPYIVPSQGVLDLELSNPLILVVSIEDWKDLIIDFT